MNNAQRCQEVIRRSGVEPKRCMGCGKCSATCPAYDEMEYHPHQFVSMIKNGNIEPLLSSPSLFCCLSCFACAERCPRGVEPAKLIEAVRLEVIREKGANHLKAETVPSLTDEETPGQLLVSAFRKFSK